MKKLVVSILVGVLVALPVVVSAQVDRGISRPGTPNKTVLDNPIKTGFSLLDPQRLKIRHAYSLSYFSGGGQSGTLGMYFSSIQYQLAKPLTLRVGLAYAHNPLTAFGQQTGGLVSEGIYPSFYLDYRPSSNFYLGIGYERRPGYLYAERGWRTPTGWWRTR